VGAGHLAKCCGAVMSMALRIARLRCRLSRNDPTMDNTEYIEELQRQGMPQKPKPLCNREYEPNHLSSAQLLTDLNMLWRLHVDGNDR
jgi:hypothetical protein